MLPAFLKRLTAGRLGRTQHTLARARAEFAARRFEPALGIAQGLLHQPPESEAAHALAGACRIELARAAQAAALRARDAAPDVSAHYSAAIAHFERSAQLSAQPCKALSRQAAALREAGQLAASRSVLAGSGDRCGQNVEYQLELALDCLCHGESAQARALYEEMLAGAPGDARVHAAYALALLGSGDFARGWDEYEWRLRLPEFALKRALPFPALPFPLLSGEALAHRTLFVEAEQGLGDQIMFASCLPDLMASGARLVIEASPRLAGLFAHSFPEAIVLPKSKTGHDWDTLPKIDWRVPIGSLPRFLRRSRNAFPARGPYLKAPPDLVELYRERLEQLGTGPKIGIAWRGGLPGTMSALRSLQLSDLDPLLQLGDLKFVSLEFADCRAELDAAAARGVNVAWWPEAAFDMAHFAALVSALDGVVSVATTAVHMAGALAKPTWALVARGGTWRYMWRGAEMPWYPTVHVFRPAQPGDWSLALQEVARALTERMKKP